MAPFTELSLFSGAGGGLLGTTHLLGWRTVCYVEWDKYAVEVLKARIRDGYLHDAPIWDDAFTFDGRPWAGLVDVVTAGFPCQPFSLSGKGLAEHDPRNGFPAVIRILHEVRPQLALLENVPGLISKPYFKQILGALTEAGFDIEYDCVSAAEIGANHKRERVWILCHSESNRKFHLAMERKQNEKDLDSTRTGSTISNSHITGLERTEPARTTQTDGRLAEFRGEISNAKSQQSGRVFIEQVSPNSCSSGDRSGKASWWAVEPELGRVADGVPHRVDRLRAIGNGQVPAVVREAWLRLNDQ